MDHELDAFYLNTDTHESISVVWRVTLWMPTTEGEVAVEATTTEEAARLALNDYWEDVEWDNDDYNDDSHHYAEVVDVECENPLVDAILFCHCRKTEANLDAVFEPEAKPTATEAPIQKANDGGRSCS